MATVALVPSVLGLRPSFYDLADALRENGHDVRVVDIFGGASHDTYEEGRAARDAIGIPTLMERVLDRSKDVPDGFVTMGLSLGAAGAQYLATQRTVSGAVLVAGASSMKGWQKPWPQGVPAQIHVMAGDPLLDPAETTSAATEIKDAGGSVDVFTYEGTGHLFVDKGLPDEYDAAASDQLLARVLAFLETVD